MISGCRFYILAPPPVAGHFKDAITYVNKYNYFYQASRMMNFFPFFPLGPFGLKLGNERNSQENSRNSHYSKQIPDHKYQNKIR